MQRLEAAVAIAKRVFGMPPGGREHWFWVWGALVLAILLTTAGSSVIAFGSREGGDPHFIVWGALLVLLAATLTVTNQVRAKRQARRAEEKRSAHLTRFNDNLSSMISVFVELLKSDHDAKASDQFFSAAVRQAQALVSYEGVRVCVYELELIETLGRVDESDDDGSARVEEPERYALNMKAFAGRADHPRAYFTQDNEHGKAVIGIALGNTAVPISDPKLASITVDRADDAVWCSTLLIPLRDGKKSKGIMMIDTRDPVAFTSEDKAIGWTIATIIALGMGTLVQGGRETAAEVTEARKRLVALAFDANLASANGRLKSPSRPLDSQQAKGVVNGEHS
ncbi:hypothetical protein [Arthrobacter sp. MDT1-65]